MTEVYLALGSNVGDTHANIAAAIEQLVECCLTDLRRAPLYATKAVGFTDQADFLNTAVSGTTSLEPTDLLAKIKQIEQDVGRVERFRWGPREIDIDIIFYGDLTLETPGLTIPHASFRERGFVLYPLHDLNSTMVDPVSGRTIAQLLAALPTGSEPLHQIPE